MEAELYREVMEERGLKNNLNENLEKLGEMTEFKMLNEEVEKIREKAKEKYD